MAETLSALLDRTSASHGERTAIEFGDERLSYGELRDASARVAALLAARGVEPGEPVAFCFQKGVEALVALFGIARAGAVYVPLDPAWPAERVRTICHDAGIVRWLGSITPPDGAAPGGVIPLASARELAPLSEARATPDGVANVLYTSGSTGKPKGVRISTESLLHFSRWAVETFAIAPDDRMANHAPFHFDLSTLDIFAAVRAGAAMLPVPERVKVLPYQTAKSIADTRTTIWYSVPSALVLMLQALGRLDVRSLRHVIFAGEVMPKAQLQELARRLPHVALTNLYGPTETNVCTFHEVDAADLADDGALPIGRPIDDTRVWLLDEEGREVERAGALGELVVAGPTVFPGYLGDAELTARRLGPAPDGHGLAYRTGDLVSRRADGVLLFHGRADRMIKCRGYRIEPGEIEAVLARHPSIEESAVVSFGERPDEQCLMAYVVATLEDSPGQADLAAFCRAYLPPYMIPEKWEFLGRLPRTERGKIDLQALEARHKR